MHVTIFQNSVRTVCGGVIKNVLKWPEPAAPMKIQWRGFSAVEHNNSS